MSRSLRFALFVSIAAFTTLTARAGYRVENVKYPAELRGGISAVTFTPGGTLVVATRYGEIWMRSPAGAWHLFARGLNEPMGVVADSEKIIYVAHRPELLRCTDTDGDGKADTFDAIGGSFGLSQNYHEFFFGLRRDKAGNFYGAISLESTGANSNDPSAVVPVTPQRGERRAANLLEGTFHRSDLEWRGWAIEITADGKFVPLANGFRQPCGIGLSPEGEFFTTDNQGDYKPSCGLLHVAAGDFHGHASSVKWEPGIDPAKITTEMLWKRYKPDAIVFPHGPMGVSSGEPTWDQTGGEFGPFGGQIFLGDFTKLVIRASLDRVAGAWQGACFPFLGRVDNPAYVSGDKLGAGSVRSQFGPDAALYLGETGGWGGGSDGLQRVVWDGKLTPEVRDMKLTARGFALTFTKPMSAASLAKLENFELNRFKYFYHWKYGSPWIDEAKVAVKEVRPSADGLAAELILTDLQPGFIYELSVPALRTTDNEPLANPLGYYTANRLVTGEIAPGGYTRLARPDEASLGAKDGPEVAKTPDAIAAAGEKVYRLFCVACHQPDGRGLPGSQVANFVEDKTRLAKTDALLIQTISNGSEAKGMPAFGVLLSPGQRRAVLAYIRANFGAKDADGPK